MKLYKYGAKLANQGKSLSVTLYKKLGFRLRISSVNVNKSEICCGFGHMY